MSDLSERLIIEGGHTITGPLSVGGSKNAALPLIAATLLPDGVTHVRNMPDLRDVRSYARAFETLGAKSNFQPDRDPTTPETLTIDASGLSEWRMPRKEAESMRASIYALGALLGRLGKAEVPLPGGDAFGHRPVNMHVDGMRALGAEIDIVGGAVVASAPGGRLQGGRFRFDPITVGGTINVLLAAAQARGTTLLENCAREPDVVALGRVLQKMGARIEGLGTSTIEIEGIDALSPGSYLAPPDRIELGTHMIVALLAGAPGSEVRIVGGAPSDLGDAFPAHFRATGAHFRVERPAGTAETDDYVQDVIVRVPDEVFPVSVETQPYPGLATDLQSQWTLLMTKAEGASRIIDTIYHGRFGHVPELQRMGAQIQVQGNAAVVRGPNQLHGATVEATDVRAAVALVLAGLIAKGETTVTGLLHLDRGHERWEAKLAAAGAKIRREKG
jgi:UDP-N-acetylglucosamine 1-carboxyvinyltransferase